MMDRVFDFVMEKLMPPFILLLIFGLLAALIVVLFHICREAWYPAPTFELRVDSWKCTQYVHESSTALILVGKVLVPMTTNSQRCVQWSSK